MVLPESFAAKSASSFEVSDPSIVQLTYGEVGFDGQGRRSTTFFSSGSETLLLRVTDFSVLKGTSRYKGRGDLDEKGFYRFQGTLHAKFQDDSDPSRYRIIKGSFELKWEKENRSS